VLNYILEGNTEFVTATGPLFIQSGVAPSRNQTITYTRPGVDAVFTVSGEAAPTPPNIATFFVGDQLLPGTTAGNQDDYLFPSPGNTIAFIATSWSASY
jgi:hypothetical protein